MDWKVEPLSTQNMEDLFALFEENHYDHQKEWKSCYCRFYHSKCSMHEWMNKTAESNKKEAIEAINQQKMHGFLAYDDKRCIGWLNAGTILNYPRLHENITQTYLNAQVAVTICYVVSDDYRGKKVSSSLLDYAIATFKNTQFTTMLALPNDHTITEKNYRGFKQMYLNRGYKEEKITSDLSYLILKF